MPRIVASCCLSLSLPCLAANPYVSTPTPTPTPTQFLEELKGLRGKEGAADYVELVFTRSGPTGEANEDGTTAAETAQWSSEEIGKLHLESGVDVQGPAKLELQGADGGGGSGGGGEGAVDAVSAFLACLRTDRPDGLMATVVCDTMGVALGLVSLAGSAIEGAGGAGWGCVSSVGCVNMFKGWGRGMRKGASSCAARRRSC